MVARYANRRAVLSTTSFDKEFLTPEYFRDPYPLYSRLREEAPVYWSEKLNGWLLTRFNDVKSALNDRRLNNSGRINSLLVRLPAGERAHCQQLALHMGNNMAFTDPPDHTRIRRLVGNSFTPRRVNKHKSRIQDIVGELLESMEGMTSVDLVREFAFQLPAMVICEVLGIPRDDRDKLKHWSDDIVGFLSIGAVTSENTIRAQASILAATEYIAHLVDDRVCEPREDMISALVSSLDESGGLTKDELLSSLVHVFNAGFETTEGLIGNGMLALLHYPEQMQLLQENPDLIELAVEEFLRYDNSVQRQMRVASEDIELHGRLIRKGEHLALFVGSAGRDPSQYSDPDSLDVTRQPNSHIGFGYGIHACIGGPLARIEVQAAIRGLIDRYPDIRLPDQNLAYEHLVGLRKLKSLIVKV